VPQAGFWRRILLSAATGASPDGAPAAEGALREVVVFERNCGATTDFSTQVSVLAAPGYETSREMRSSTDTKCRCR